MGSEVVVVVGRVVGEDVQGQGQYSMKEHTKVVSWDLRSRGT